MVASEFTASLLQVLFVSSLVSALPQPNPNPYPSPPITREDTTTASDIPPLALVDQPDASCLSKSLLLTNLTIYAAQVFKGSPFQAENSSVSFQLFNAATNTDAQCSAYSIALTPNAVGSDPYQWYNCFMESRDPRMTARFQYDATLNHLTVNERWVCDDMARNRSVQFTAYNFEWLDVNCTDSAASQRTCVQPEGNEIYFPVEVTAKDL
ncbi:hypothetical protein B0H66DRAFT_626824 [Apodospora peruviana]|uniref:AA1-like domain-containing protein n=1 Tax=Apodospora peruviana TaxID=516989 RepID=A0AAE0I3R2_9PEZI|nr:hypothetical protein B0H66DRAFT_626824 [Apodospora peruviana]